MGRNICSEGQYPQLPGCGPGCGEAEQCEVLGFGADQAPNLGWLV